MRSLAAPTDVVTAVAPRVQLHKKSAWLLYLIVKNATPTAYNRNEVASACAQRFYPHTGNGGLSF